MTSCTATFIFYNTLTDFLPAAKKSTPLLYTFTGTPSVKDAIETLGVPHVEVDVIVVNGTSVDFTYLLSNTVEVQVYPKYFSPQTGQVQHLLENYPQKPAFILDVHLGKLARQQRMLGFDALYETDYADNQIASIASAQNRIVLTRDILLLKRKAIKWGYWLRSQQTEEQLVEVMTYFRLLNYVDPFTRCMACNGHILSVDKSRIIAELQAQTRECFHEFYQCTSCEKIYWKGSHYEKMLRRIEQLE
jgi:hypothetical protein